MRVSESYGLLAHFDYEDDAGPESEDEDEVAPSSIVFYFLFDI